MHSGVKKRLMVYIFLWIPLIIFNSSCADNIGEYVASKLRGLKVAAVYPQELITKFAENTVVNRGASLIVVGDREQAIKRLLESQPNKADTSDA